MRFSTSPHACVVATTASSLFPHSRRNPDPPPRPPPQEEEEGTCVAVCGETWREACVRPLSLFICRRSGAVTLGVVARAVLTEAPVATIAVATCVHGRRPEAGGAGGALPGRTGGAARSAGRSPRLLIHLSLSHAHAHAHTRTLSLSFPFLRPSSGRRTRLTTSSWGARARSVSVVKRRDERVSALSIQARRAARTLSLSRLSPLSPLSSECCIFHPTRPFGEWSDEEDDGGCPDCGPPGDPGGAPPPPPPAAPA